MQIRVTAIAALALGGACLAVPAQAGGQDSAASEALFNKGVAEMEAGTYESACPALAESNRLDPRAGTMFTLAECEAKWGKTASAVAHYADYVGLVSRMIGADQRRHHDRAKTAEQQIAKLRPQVPQLSLVLPEGAPAGTVVKRDGVTLSGVSLGTALPVDPGDHVIVTQVPGGPEHEQKVSIGVGESKRLALELKLPVNPAPTTRAAAMPAVEREGPRVERDASPSSGTKTWAYIAGGIGLAGLAAGSVTGFMSMSKKKTVDDNCAGPVCNAKGLEAAEDGKTLGNISTAGFGVGIVGLAAGVVLWLAAPQPKSQERSGVVRPTVFASSNSTCIGVQGPW